MSNTTQSLELFVYVAAMLFIKVLRELAAGYRFTVTGLLRVLSPLRQVMVAVASMTLPASFFFASCSLPSTTFR